MSRTAIAQTGDSYAPALRWFPDGRRASWRLLDPALLFYASVSLGSPAAALAALWNAALLRRWKLAMGTLALGAVGWFGFLAVVRLLEAGGVASVGWLLLGGRLWHLVVGWSLYLLHRRHARGSALLGGGELPLLQAMLIALLLGFVLPRSVRLFFMGIPLGG